MRVSKSRGFTLVELLVVIGIIALLIGILLPVLGKARESANTIKCGSNLHGIGQGMAIYLAENKNVFPPAYIYNGMQLLSIGSPNSPGVQLPPNDGYGGYVHWSSYIYTTSARIANDPNRYAQLSGWGMFQCPSFDKGGLPPTNTFAGNYEPNQAGDAFAPGSIPGGWNGCDLQAPRLAYTVNEAVCPRNKFAYGFGNPPATRVYQCINAGQIQDSSGTILATEFNQNWTVVQAVGEASGNTVCKSHRPVSGFIGTDGSTVDFDQLPAASGGGLGGNAASYRRVTVGDLANDPISQQTVGATRLDWVGRNHGSNHYNAKGFNTKTSNFLYVDFHVENKSITATLAPKFQWGARLYTLSPNSDLQNP